jgi:multisubunit Na+/H+ antiporter MnhG subunit
VRAADAVTGVLVALAFLSVLLSSAGLVAAKTGWDKLHYTGPANIVGPVAIAAAVLVEDSVTSASVKAVLAAVVLLVTGPALVHATGRAARVREHGRFVILSEELEQKEHHPSKPSRQ